MSIIAESLKVEATAAIERLEALVESLNADVATIRNHICVSNDGLAYRGREVIRVLGAVLEYRYLQHPLPKLGPPAPPPAPPTPAEIGKRALEAAAWRKQLAVIHQNAVVEERRKLGLPDEPVLSPYFRPEQRQSAPPAPPRVAQKRLLGKTPEMETWIDDKGNTAQDRIVDGRGVQPIAR